MTIIVTMGLKFSKPHLTNFGAARMFFCLIFCGCFHNWNDDVVIGGSTDCVHNVWLESMVGVELLVVLWDAYDGVC